MEWSNRKECCEAWLSLDFLPPGASFAYRNNSNMTALALNGCNKESRLFHRGLAKSSLNQMCAKYRTIAR